MQKAPKLNLLDHFYDHLEEQDWLSGVDLYQAGRVLDLSTYEGLVTAKVSPETQGKAEVRLKIHPSGRCIQWIECTCRKNRSAGQYCEHIAAFMIHVDRETPALFSKLDSTMPLKPPSAPRKQRGVPAPAPVPVADGALGRLAGATQTIIDHLKGNIQSVSLLAHGPQLRVRIEIKPGHLTHYDLPIDASAKFLKSHPKLTTATNEVRELKVYDQPVELGTRIYLAEEEKIVAERVVAIRLGKKSFVDDIERTTIGFEAGRYKRVASDDPTGSEGDFLFIPLKTAAKYLGDENVFLPGRGYLKLDKAALGNTFDDLPLSRSFKEDDAAKFARDAFRDYTAAGPVFLDENLKGQVIMETPELGEVEFLDGGDGWFRLDPKYGKGDAAISMVELMKQYRKKKRQFVRSGNVWLKVPDFVTEHQWELDETGDAIKVDALGLMRIKAAVGDFDQFVGSKKALVSLKDKLTFVPESNEPPEHGTKINLRHYQQMGLAWLWWLYKNGLHGLLADEMGLGKTHQAMAMMCAVKRVKPDAKFLVVCPTTVLDHWIDKVEEFAPILRPLKYHGPKRLGLLKELVDNKDTIVTSYGIILRDIKHLVLQNFEIITLDEAHFVKNNDTATYQAVCRLPGKLRVCLTGTPMENHLGELKSIFDFLVPGYLGSDEYFRKSFIAPLATGQDLETTLVLQKLIHPFKMRRTKEEVLPDLPAKVIDFRNCALSEEQIKHYREIVALKASPLVKQLKDDNSPIPFLHVFATLTLLKQVCDHPALLGEPSAWRKHESGKFELLKELLVEAMGSGHKVVIFSQYLGMIRIISEHLTDSGIQHVTLTGQTKNRGETIKKFQTDENCKVFIGSLLAGGIGIDLTAASIVIHYDRWWNASKENQATDRVHRIGQLKSVLVLKLITRGTLEEKIDRMIQAKQALFEKFLDKDEEIFKALSRQELIELLQ